MTHHIGDECPGGHLFSLVDFLETAVERWIEDIKEQRLDASAWRCVDDVRALISRYAHEGRLEPGGS